MSSGFAHLDSAELTDVGRCRKKNEDAILRLPAQGFFCVADGMGGAQSGDVASQATVDALRAAFTESPDGAYALTAAASGRLAEYAVNQASQWIKARADACGLSGTGSTLVALAFDSLSPDRALLLHAGDSRAYRLRGDRLALLTADHSIAHAAGCADDKSLPVMFRGVITRAVGIASAVQLEETAADVAAGDLFLLCSDGLTRMLDDRRLAKLLRAHRRATLPASARALVDAALEAGGEDNISVVLVAAGPALPQGPTHEAPARTLELERLPKPAPPQPKPAADDPDADTGDGPGQDTDRTDDPRPPTPPAERQPGAAPPARAPQAGESGAPEAGGGDRALGTARAGEGATDLDPVLRSCIWGVNIALLILYAVAFLLWLFWRRT